MTFLDLDEGQTITFTFVKSEPPRSAGGTGLVRLRACDAPRLLRPQVWSEDELDCLPAEVEALGDQAREAPDHHLLRDPRQELALGSFGTTDSEVLAEVLEHPVIVGKAITPFRQGVVGQGLRRGGVGAREVESGANTRR